MPEELALQRRRHGEFRLLGRVLSFAKVQVRHAEGRS
jgi:hypothetical protein